MLLPHLRCPQAWNEKWFILVAGKFSIQTGRRQLQHLFFSFFAFLFFLRFFFAFSCAVLCSTPTPRTPSICSTGLRCTCLLDADRMLEPQCDARFTASGPAVGEKKKQTIDLTHALAFEKVRSVKILS